MWEWAGLRNIGSLSKNIKKYWIWAGPFTTYMARLPIASFLLIVTYFSIYFPKIASQLLNSRLLFHLRKVEKKLKHITPFQSSIGKDIWHFVAWILLLNNNTLLRFCFFLYSSPSCRWNVIHAHRIYLVVLNLQKTSGSLFSLYLIQIKEGKKNSS